MSRGIPTDLMTALESGNFSPRLFYEGQFRNTSTMAVEYLRLWTGYGAISWDSKTWSGTGVLGVDGIEETVERRTVGFRVSLEGISIPNRTIALDANKSRNLPGTIWLAAMSKADGTLIVDPHLARRGLLDVVKFTDTAETLTIVAEYEDENVAMLKPYDRRYTPEDQALDTPGDKGFDMVAQLQDMVIAF